MGGFLLRKGNCSDPKVLQSIIPELRDSHPIMTLSDSEQYTKTLGIEWNSRDDHFRVSVFDLPHVQHMTKRALVSDVAKIFNAYYYDIKAKILLQSLRSAKIGWDDLAPDNIMEEWSSQLPMLSCPTVTIPKDPQSSLSSYIVFWRRHIPELCTSDWKILMVVFTHLWSYPRCVLHCSRGRLSHVWSCVGH